MRFCFVFAIKIFNYRSLAPWCDAVIVEAGRTGLRFNPGEATDLAVKVTWAGSHPQEMGRAARREFELKYTAERNDEMLLGI